MADRVGHESIDTLSEKDLKWEGSTLWEQDGEALRLRLSVFEFVPLDLHAEEQRFITLQPCDGDKNAETNHVKCTMSTERLRDAKPFTAVSNGRGYRPRDTENWWTAIEVNGAAMLVSWAMERFLRNFRHDSEPIRLWTRYLCLGEYAAEGWKRDEQQRYWNRAFVDSMYSRAIEVVDMHKFLNKLLDHNIIERVIDPKWSSWSKDWESHNVVPAWPKSWPNRLGRPVGRVDRYDYVPLDGVANEIRLLVLYGSEDTTAPLLAGLGHCPMICEVPFHCLSYTWGDAQSVGEVTMAPQTINVRKNLESALRALRRPNKNWIVIWADALCINQDDIEERNRNIPRMYKLYDRALAVLCYAGEPDEDSDLALEFLPYLQGPQMRLKDGKWETEFGPASNQPRPIDFERRCAAFYRFLLRPYFRRVWIIQEIAAASNPGILCGSHQLVSFDDLDTASRNLQEMVTVDPLLVTEMTKVTPGFTVEDFIIEELMYVRKLYYFRYIMSGGSQRSMPLMRYVNHGVHEPGFLEAAVLARDFQATDGRDKLFALWNLARDKDRLDFRMDYSKSVIQSYTEFAIAWCRLHKSLDIIAAVEFTDSGMQFYNEAPSWCPNWATPLVSSSLVRREAIPNVLMALVRQLDGPLYSATGGESGPVPSGDLFEISNGVLVCHVLHMERLQIIFDPAPLDIPGYLYRGCSWPDTYLAYYYWFDQIRDYYADHHFDTYSNLAQATTAMFHGDVSSTWVPAEKCVNENAPYEPWKPTPPDYQAFKELYPYEDFICQVYKARHIRYYAPNYKPQEAWDAVRRVIRGRLPCFTTAGYLGLAPSYIKQECRHRPRSIAIIAGCSVPIVLEDNGDDSYTILGSAFVQGWMEGEVFQGQNYDTMNGLPWIAETNRIRIV